MTRYDKAKAYHYLYDSKAWKGRRAAQLSAYPLCAFCERMGKFVSATVADHIRAHKGDDVLFFEGELQSLCKPCHDSAKQREENAGFSSAVDVDGYPIDPRHPSNR